MALKLRKLSYALGAEVCDIDVFAPLSEAAFGEIYQAFLAHGILLFRNQDITREQHIEFSRRFGELDKHDALPADRHPQHPELLLVTNEPNADGTPSISRYTGRQWHSDMSFTPVPSLGSLLKSWTVPEVGGDTLFANMTLAYDTLSEGMKKLIADAVKLNDDGIKVSKVPVSKEKKELVVPEILAAALESNAVASETFNNFPYSCKKEYVEWITEAKTEATREKRLATTLEWLAEGKRRNWKYEKCEY